MKWASWAEREIVEGTRFVFRHPHLRAITRTTTTANFFRSALLAVLLVYLLREAGASAGAIGIAFAIGNIGFVLAALVAPTASRRYGLGRTMRVAVSLFARFLNFGTMPLGTVLGGTVATLIGLRPALWIFAAGMFLPALPYSLSTTGRLTELPDHAPTP